MPLWKWKKFWVHGDGGKGLICWSSWKGNFWWEVITLRVEGRIVHEHKIRIKAIQQPTNTNCRNLWNLILFFFRKCKLNRESKNKKSKFISLLLCNNDWNSLSKSNVWVLATSWACDLFWFWSADSGWISIISSLCCKHKFLRTSLTLLF